PTTYNVGSNPRGLAIADLNKDGKKDVAIANVNGSSFSVLLGTGGGALAAAISYSTGSSTSPENVVVDDFNSDGKHDVAVANLNNGRTGVYLGNGDGTLQAAQSYAVNSIALAMGDFNEDGRPDLATASYSNGSVTVLFGNNVKPLAEDP